MLIKQRKFKQIINEITDMYFLRIIHNNITNFSNIASKIYPADWISMLKRRKWIPISKSEHLNSNSLAILIKEEDELLNLCRKEKPMKSISLLMP